MAGRRTEDFDEEAQVFDEEAQVLHEIIPLSEGKGPVEGHQSLNSKPAPRKPKMAPYRSRSTRNSSGTIASPSVRLPSSRGHFIGEY